ncbi:MAG: hypothetical protein SGBAC_010285 [Bacillariaceae sp.]
MVESDEASVSIPSPPVDVSDEESDEGEYFYPSAPLLSIPISDDEEEKKARISKIKKKKSKKKKTKKSGADVTKKETADFLDMPSPVKTTNRRLSFPLQRADMAEDGDGDAADDASGNLKDERNALHEDGDDIFSVSTPPGSSKMMHRSRSMESACGAIKASVLKRKPKQPKASDLKNGKGWTMSPANPVSRKSSKTPTPEPPTRKPHSLSVPSPAPLRRRATADENGGLKQKAPVRRGSTMEAVKPPTRRKSTMDATFAWQPREPKQPTSRRRSSMSMMKPSSNATDLFYVDPFAKTNKETQVEQGKKIEHERATRRNSLPSATMAVPPHAVTTPPPKMRHSKSQDFSLCSPSNDDPYDEEGNLIRRKAPRRRSVTNTPQRFKAVAAGTTPVVNTPEFDYARKVRMENNMKEAMQIDPFEDTEEAALNDFEQSKGFPSESKMRSSSFDKGQRPRSGSLKDQLGGKNGSTTSIKTTSTANSTDLADSRHSSSDLNKLEPRIEPLKGGGDTDLDESQRTGRRLSNSSGPKEPRRRSKKRGKSKDAEDGTLGTPTQKKSLLNRRKSSSPKQGRKKKPSGRLLSGSRGLSNSNHSHQLSSDDDNDGCIVLEASPKRPSGSSSQRGSQRKTRRTFAGQTLKSLLGSGIDGKGVRKPEPPSRCKSDAGPRAIRISMTGNVDLLSNADAREPSIRRRRRMSIDEDETEEFDGDDSSIEESQPAVVASTSSESLDSMPISRVPSGGEEPPKRNSGGSIRRRFSIGNTSAALVETDPAQPTEARTSKLPMPRKPAAFRRSGRRNSVR